MTLTDCVWLQALQKEVDALRKHHPHVTTWLSPCGLTEVALDAWVASLDTANTRSFLSGVAYGPGVHVSQKQLVERLPAGYELRQYPDISHSLAAMYPVRPAGGHSDIIHSLTFSAGHF